MSSLLARVAILGTFALALAACSNGSGGALPFAGPPNNGSGGTGQFQSGGNGAVLLRFIQGSPDKFSTFGGPPASGTVDLCIDNLPFGVTAPATNYGQANPVLYAIAGGISHTVATYPTLGVAMVGLECPTAPGPYLGTPPIKVFTLTPPAGSSRETIVLGGTGASGTLGYYVYNETTFVTTPSSEAITHNAAPVFSTGKPNGVGFGICTVTVTPCTVATSLTGAQSLSAPNVSSTTATVFNGFVISSLAAPPVGFYDGTGVAAGTPVPITSIAALSAQAGQPYVIQLYAFDAPAGGLNLVAVPEQTLGFGF
jgi:hypothetical protein